MKKLENSSKASIVTKSVPGKTTRRKRNPTTQTTEAPDIDLLRHLHIIAQNELIALQDQHTRVFTGSSLLFLFVIGGLFVFVMQRAPMFPLWASRGSLATAIVSVVLLLVALFSIRWQQRVEEIQAEVLDTQTKIEKLLHCYDEDYYAAFELGTLYPKRWAKSKNSYKRIGFRRGWFRFNSIFATALLGIAAVIMLWIL